MDSSSDRPVLDHHPQELAREEGVALGTVEDRAHDLGRSLSVQQVFDQGRPSPAESGERRIAVVFATPPPHPGRRSNSSGRAMHRRSHAVGSRRDRLDEVEQPRIGPVQILDHGHQRSIRGERLDVSLPRSNDHLMRRLRLGTRQRVGVQLDPDRGEQDACHADPLVSWEARVQPGSRLAEGRRGGVAVEDPGVRLQDLGEGPVGEAVAVGQAPTSNDPSALRLEGSRRLARQATLPDARGPTIVTRPGRASVRVREYRSRTRAISASRPTNGVSRPAASGWTASPPTS